jgi:hypothetical protein
MPNFHRRFANYSRAGRGGLKEDYRIGAVLRIGWNAASSAKT